MDNVYEDNCWEAISEMEIPLIRALRSSRVQVVSAYKESKSHGPKNNTKTHPEQQPNVSPDNKST